MSEQQQVPFLRFERQLLGQVVAQSVERRAESLHDIFWQKSELNDGVDSSWSAPHSLGDHLDQVVVEDWVGLKAKKSAHELAPA